MMNIAVAVGIGVASGVYIFRPMITGSGARPQTNPPETGGPFAEVWGTEPYVDQLNTSSRQQSQEAKARPSN